jgi:hypothetical protein
MIDSENLNSNLRIMFEIVTLNSSKKFNHIAFIAGDHHSTPKLSDITLQQAMLSSKIRLIAPMFIAKFISTRVYMHLTSSSSFTLTRGIGTTKPLPRWLMPIV